MSRYPEELQKIILNFKKLPGVGSRTAERFAFELLNWNEEELGHFGKLVVEIQKKTPPCPTCGCITHQGHCSFCDLKQRDPHTLCILASAREVFSIEETGTFQGLYHILEHLLSPLDGRHAHNLRIERIEERIRTHKVQETIIALDSTLEGDTTSLYLREKLSHLPTKITRLAFGLPVGSPLDHIDGGTLMRALRDRSEVK